MEQSVVVRTEKDVYAELLPVQLGRPSTAEDRKKTEASGLNCLAYNPEWTGLRNALYGLVRASRGEIPREVAVEGLDRNIAALLNSPAGKEGGPSTDNQELHTAELWICNHLAKRELRGGPAHFLPALMLATYVQEKLLPLLKPTEWMQAEPGTPGTHHYAKEAFPWLCAHASVPQILRFDRIFGIEQDDHSAGCCAIVRTGNWEHLDDYLKYFPASLQIEAAEFRNSIKIAIRKASGLDDIRYIEDRFPILSAAEQVETYQQRFRDCLYSSAHAALQESHQLNCPIALTEEALELIIAATRSRTAMREWAKGEDAQLLDRDLRALHEILEEGVASKLPQPLNATREPYTRGASAYLDEIKGEEQRRSIRYFPDERYAYQRDCHKYGGGYEAFSHLPYDWLESSQPASTATLESDPKDLIAKACTFNIAWGERNYELDVRGGALEESMTRPLSPLGKAVLTQYASREGRYLELGAGAGYACAQVADHSRLLVDSVALVPTNPVVRLELSHAETHVALARELHETGRSWEEWDRLAEQKDIGLDCRVALKRFYYCTQANRNALLYDGYPIASKFILECQKLLPALKVFSQDAAPFIDRQYIGSFPDSVRLPKAHYQVIHEEFGPLWHQSRIRTFGDTIPPRTIDELICHSYPALAKDGVLVCTAIEMNRSNLAALKETLPRFLNDPYRNERAPLWAGRGSGISLSEDLPAQGDLFLVGDEVRKAPMMVIRKESPLQAPLRDTLKLKGVGPEPQFVPHLVERVAAAAILA